MAEGHSGRRNYKHLGSPRGLYFGAFGRGRRLSGWGGLSLRGEAFSFLSLAAALCVLEKGARKAAASVESQHVPFRGTYFLSQHVPFRGTYFLNQHVPFRGTSLLLQALLYDTLKYTLPAVL
eukprot:1152842-Pelagomonas_calceolata.AAC.13